MPNREEIYEKVSKLFAAHALWIICLTICVVSYIGYATWPLQPWAKDLLLHLATASFIAFFIDVFFEYNFRIKHIEKWGSNVLQAVAGTLVPTSIVKEVVAILKSEIVRKDCIYTITFLQPPPDVGGNHLLLKRDLSYMACNKISRKVPFAITSLLENPARSGHTKHLKLKVDGTEISDLAPITSRDGAYDKLFYEYPRGLAPNAEIPVFISGQELVEINLKQSAYILLKPCESLEIVPNNYYDGRIGRITVRMHHPVSDEIEPDDQGRFKFGYAMLPGQGFDIVWETKGGA